MRRPSFRVNEVAAVLLVAAAAIAPFMTENLFIYSILNQVLVGCIAGFSVYIMLRMNLLTFATPPFMALGGYAVAIVGVRLGVTNVFALTAISFLVPALASIPLAAFVLRLRGTYFVLITFTLAEVMQIVLFLTPDLTGGAGGLGGFPSPTLGGVSLEDNQSVLFLTIGLALLAMIVTAVATSYFRRHFSAIEQNETLAESLGLVIWRYKSLGFVISAGVAGLAGFALINMLLTANPKSFTSDTAVNYIAYVIVGGRASLLGVTIGATLLVVTMNLLGGQGEYSQGLYGLLLIAVVLIAKGGIAGAVENLSRFCWPNLVSRTHSPKIVEEARR